MKKRRRPSESLPRPAAGRQESPASKTAGPHEPQSVPGLQPFSGHSVGELQRGLGNAGFARMMTSRTEQQLASAGRTDSATTIQRGGETEEGDRPMRIPEWMGLAISMSDFRSIPLEAIAALNDDQMLDLKQRLDTWKSLYEDTPDFLKEQYKKAKGKGNRKQAYDLFMQSTKVAHAFKFRYEPVSQAAERIARRRGFSIEGASFGPKPEGESEFVSWTRTIKGGLSARAGAVFQAVLPEVKRQLEFLLWEMDYPVPPKTNKSYWMKYGYWGEGPVHHKLAGGERRTEWEDFAEDLSDAASPVAQALNDAIGSGEGPASVIRSIENLTGAITAGFNEIIGQAEGVLSHGINDVNIYDLYRLAQQMRDESGSVMSCYAEGFIFKTSG